MKPIPWIALGALHRDIREKMHAGFVTNTLTVCVIQAIPDRETAFAVVGDSKLLLENLALDHEWLNIQPDKFHWAALYFPGVNLDQLVNLLAKERITLVILRPFG